MLMMPRLVPDVQSDNKRCAFFLWGCTWLGSRSQAISDSLEIRKCTVSLWLNKFQIKGAVEDEEPSGRLRPANNQLHCWPTATSTLS